MQYVRNFFIILLVATTVSTSQFFRKDYTYIGGQDAFYKLHKSQTIMISWDDAFLKCQDEEAKLFYPQDQNEWKVVKNLTLKDSNVTDDVFVGFHDEFDIGELMSVDGNPTPAPIDNRSIIAQYNFSNRCLTINIKTDEYNIVSCSGMRSQAGFFCKKQEERPCPTIDQGYKFNAFSNKCYKVNQRAKTWKDALRTCYMEGGRLAVGGVEEFKHIFVFLNNNKYYIGVRRAFGNRDFYTVTGKKYINIIDGSTSMTRTPQIDEYPDTFNTENLDNTDVINNSHPDIVKNCGAVTCGHICAVSPVDCNAKMPFVCEMDIK